MSFFKLLRIVAGGCSGVIERRQGGVDLHHKFTGSLDLFFAGNKTFAQATRLEAVLLLDCSAGNDTFPVLLNDDSGTFNFIRIGL